MAAAVAPRLPGQRYPGPARGRIIAPRARPFPKSQAPRRADPSHLKSTGPGIGRGPRPAATVPESDGAVTAGWQTSEREEDVGSESHTGAGITGSAIRAQAGVASVARWSTED